MLCITIEAEKHPSAMDESWKRSFFQSIGFDINFRAMEKSARTRFFDPSGLRDTIDALIISAMMEILYFPDLIPAFRSIYVERISWSMESTCSV